MNKKARKGILRGVFLGAIILILNQLHNSTGHGHRNNIHVVSFSHRHTRGGVANELRCSLRQNTIDCSGDLSFSPTTLTTYVSMSTPRRSRGCSDLASSAAPGGAARSALGATWTPWAWRAPSRCAGAGTRCPPPPRRCSGRTANRITMSHFESFQTWDPWGVRHWGVL